MVTKFLDHNNRKLKQRRRRSENGKKKNNSFIFSKPNNFARASRFFIHFLTVVARLNETNERLNLYGLGVHTSSRKIGTVRVKNFDLFLIR